MATVVPFKAVRPAKNTVSRVVSHPYERYAPGALEAILHTNPYSFLNIIHPGYPVGRGIPGAKRFAQVRERYLEFKQKGLFIEDTDPSFYIYRITDGQHISCGIIGAVSTDDYKNNIVRKHEDTLYKRERLFKKYLSAVHFNAEPVLLTYPDNPAIEKLVSMHTNYVPEYRFTDTQGRLHELWKCSDIETIVRLQKEFHHVPALYIADGHHRTASSYLLAEEMKALHSTNPRYGFFMSYLLPESSLRIAGFDRLVTDLNGLSKDDFLERLQTWYYVKNKGQEGYSPSEKHHFNMYLDGTFYELELRESYSFSDALSQLDAQILYCTILKPVLGITDVRNNKRLEYSAGENTIMHLKKLVDKGVFAVGFALAPVTVTELKKIADEGSQMPPKSTYITPKLLSGLTIYEF